MSVRHEIRRPGKYLLAVATYKKSKSDISGPYRFWAHLHVSSTVLLP